MYHSRQKNIKSRSKNLINEHHHHHYGRIGAQIPNMNLPSLSSIPSTATQVPNTTYAISAQPQQPQQAQPQPMAPIPIPPEYLNGTWATKQNANQMPVIATSAQTVTGGMYANMAPQTISTLNNTNSMQPQSGVATSDTMYMPMIGSSFEDQRELDKTTNTLTEKSKEEEREVDKLRAENKKLRMELSGKNEELTKMQKKYKKTENKLKEYKDKERAAKVKKAEKKQKRKTRENKRKRKLKEIDDESSSAQERANNTPSPSPPPKRRRSARIAKKYKNVEKK